jgi:hypothetical protein
MLAGPVRLNRAGKRSLRRLALGAFPLTTLPLNRRADDGARGLA